MALLTQYRAAGDRLFSPAIWQGFKDLDSAHPSGYMMNGGTGALFFDDFFDFPTGRYTVTEVDVGAAIAPANGDVAGIGTLVLTTSATTNEGFNIQHGLTNGEWVLPAVNNTVRFECRVKANSVTAGDLFFGLFVTDTTIIASGVMSTATNYIGIGVDGGTSALLFRASKAGTVATTANSTLVVDTWTKLGFTIVTENSVLVAKQYVNGVQVGSNLTATNIPVVEIRPSMVVQSHAAGAVTVDVDWMACSVDA